MDYINSFTIDASDQDLKEFSDAMEKWINQ